MINRKHISIVSVAMLLYCMAIGQSRTDAFVDSVYASLSLEERIGQLFMIRAHSDLGADHIASVKNQIEKYHVGGMCFFQGTPEGHANLINEYQAMSRQPLMIAIDAEWGPGMRFRETAMNYPRQLMLGAIQDNQLLYDMGVEVGRQLRQIGIHLNFAPVVDVNNNPDNPVIYDRSFGEDIYNVTAKSYQYMRGMQDAGVMACAKHFPGHGDTDVDSHYDLPLIEHNRNRLDSLELYPFSVLIDKGVESVMVAHLNVPSLDNSENIPTTLSRAVVTGLLREELGFDGLVFTDALEMRGVTKHFAPGEVEVRAMQAGNDVLCLPSDINAGFDAVLAAVKTGAISEDQLATSVKRILRAKVSLDLYENVLADAGADMFPKSGLAVKEALVENSITAVANTQEVYPIRDVEQSIATLVVGSSGITSFQKRIESYAAVKHVSVGHGEVAGRRKVLGELLGQNDLVIAGITDMKKYASQDFGLDPATLGLLHELDEQTNLVVVVFGSPYSLQKFEGFESVVLAYQDDPLIQDVTAQALFGAISFQGRLPVTASGKFKVNHGIMIPSLGRLGYSSPERVRMSSDTLARIAEIVEEMIEEEAAPGCQIVVARDGKIVFQESYGHFMYDKQRPVQDDDLYDVASITKVAATTMAAMKLYESGDFYPRQTLDYYLNDVQNTNKEHLVIQDVMAHQAGLQPWIPFHSETCVREGSTQKPSPELYRSHEEKDFTIQVAEGLYLKNTHVDSIWKRILDSKLRLNRGYRYSDLGFYILAEIIERQTQNSLDKFAAREFYIPLGMTTTGYRPLERFNADRIAPTEEDKSFRKQRLQGFVHDAGSALLGGVGGHAGVFSSAGDLAILMQMLLNGGTYGGTCYLDESTITDFTTRVPGSKRRALGFDMKNLEEGADLQLSELASDQTYGHTGFTGTCVWVDPESELVFVFLSNRTYPSARTNKLSKLEIRERIHTLIYKSFNF